METWFEYESPVKRALADPDRVFNHEAGGLVFGSGKEIGG
jgi:hypothetical protein